jgi:hypothetical protein
MFCRNFLAMRTQLARLPHSTSPLFPKKTSRAQITPLLYSPIPPDAASPIPPITIQRRPSLTRREGCLSRILMRRLPLSELLAMVFVWPVTQRPLQKRRLVLSVPAQSRETGGSCQAGELLPPPSPVEPVLSATGPDLGLLIGILHYL